MSYFDQMPYPNMHELNLDWVLKKVRDGELTIQHAQDTINKYMTDMNTKFDALKAQQDAQALEIKNMYQVALNKLVSTIIPQLITFGITDDGYFVAYIPEQWHDLMFYTDVSNYNSYTFGRLQLFYQMPDSSGFIWKGES